MNQSNSGAVASNEQLGLVFDAWWREQNTGLGDAHRFTAWNAWLEATKRAVSAERERCAKAAEAIKWAPVAFSSSSSRDHIDLVIDAIRMA